MRDGYGDLRPLWDCEQSQVDRSKEKKWQGYKSGHSYQSEESPLSPQVRIRVRHGERDERARARHRGTDLDGERIRVSPRERRERRENIYDEDLVDIEIYEINPQRPYCPTVREVDADPRPIERPVIIEKDSRSQDPTRYSERQSYDFPSPPDMPSRERLRPGSPPIEGSGSPQVSRGSRAFDDYQGSRAA